VRLTPELTAGTVFAGAATPADALGLCPAPTRDARGVTS
jgi:hypothetical protein